MTRRQLIAAASTCTLATTALGVPIGVVLGWAVSRLMLVEIARGWASRWPRPASWPPFVALGVVVVSAAIALVACMTGLGRRGLSDLRRVETVG